MIWKQIRTQYTKLQFLELIKGVGYNLKWQESDGGDLDMIYRYPFDSN